MKGLAELVGYIVLAVIGVWIAVYIFTHLACSACAVSVGAAPDKGACFTYTEGGQGSDGTRRVREYLTLPVDCN